MMNRYPLLACLVAIASLYSIPTWVSASDVITPERESLGFRLPDAKNFPNLFVWTDVCNVYVLRDGNEALLINLGDGSVLANLPSIGVDRVSWLLLTDHHREQFQGIELLDRASTKIAAPGAEKRLLESPLDFRKWEARLGDPHTVHGASYIRPPRFAIKLDRALEPDSKFIWRGIELECLSTPGHSPGGMSFALKNGERTAVMLGGVMRDGAKMVNWFDTEWDYGFGKGLDTLLETVDRLSKRQLHLACPTQGPVITDPIAQLKDYHKKLSYFRKRYVRGYQVFDAAPEDFDPISKRTIVPNINRVSPHLYKLSHDHPGKNFSIIISDRGKGLIVDCGLFPEKMLDQMIVGMREHLGLKTIDALWITHYHGDHFLLGPALQKKYGVEAWALDRVADKCERPHHYDYAALVSAYDDGFDGMKIDRRFRSGDTLEWEGYTLHFDWMPGQTEFGGCLWLELDGKRVAFTGDNLFGNPRKKADDGHECVVARNSGIIEEGYLQAANYLRDLKPDLLMGGHSYVMDRPSQFIDRYHAWATEMITLYDDLLPDEDYEYLFDPYWVSAYPYRVELLEKQEAVVNITIRNLRNRSQLHKVALKLPPGVSADPAILSGSIPAHSRKTFPVKLNVEPDAVVEDIQIVTFDITLDEKRYGELFDFLIKTPTSKGP